MCKERGGREDKEGKEAKGWKRSNTVRKGGKERKGRTAKGGQARKKERRRKGEESKGRTGEEGEEREESRGIEERVESNVPALHILHNT